MAAVWSYPTRFVLLDVIWGVPPTAASRVYIGDTSISMRNHTTSVKITSGIRARWPPDVRSMPHIEHRKYN